MASTSKKATTDLHQVRSWILHRLHHQHWIETMGGSHQKTQQRTI